MWKADLFLVARICFFAEMCFCCEMYVSLQYSIVGRNRDHKHLTRRVNDTVVVECGIERRIKS